MSSLKSGGNGIEKIEDAIDFVNNRLSVDELGVPSTSSTPIDLVHVTLTSPVEDQLNTCTSNSLANDHVPDSKLNNLPNENAAQIPSELIANCVATFLMIQVNFLILCSFLIFSLFFLLNICLQDLTFYVDGS